MAKRLAKRSKPAPAEKAGLEAVIDTLVGSNSECPDVVMPDPDGEDKASHPEKYRKSMPAGKISHTCGCGIISTIYVDNPDDYDEQSRIEMFLDRGGSYNPSYCRWCLKRLPESQRKKIVKVKDADRLGCKQKPVEAVPSDVVDEPGD